MHCCRRRRRSAALRSAAPATLAPSFQPCPLQCRTVPHSVSGHGRSVLQPPHCSSRTACCHAHTHCILSRDSATPVVYGVLRPHPARRPPPSWARVYRVPSVFCVLWHQAHVNQTDPQRNEPKCLERRQKRLWCPAGLRRSGERQHAAPATERPCHFCVRTLAAKAEVISEKRASWRRAIRSHMHAATAAAGGRRGDSGHASASGHLALLLALIGCCFSLGARSLLPPPLNPQSACAGGAAQRPARQPDTQDPDCSCSRQCGAAPCRPVAVPRSGGGPWRQGRSSRGGSKRGTTCAARWPSRAAGQGRTICRAQRQLLRPTVSAAQRPTAWMDCGARLAIACR